MIPFSSSANDLSRQIYPDLNSDLSSPLPRGGGLGTKRVCEDLREDSSHRSIDFLSCRDDLIRRKQEPITPSVPEFNRPRRCTVSSVAVRCIITVEPVGSRAVGKRRSRERKNKKAQNHQLSIIWEVMGSGCGCGCEWKHTRSSCRDQYS